MGKGTIFPEIVLKKLDNYTEKKSNMNLDISGVMKMLHFLLENVSIQVYVFFQLHQAVYIKVYSIQVIFE
jgi:hypothetical protein